MKTARLRHFPIRRCSAYAFYGPGRRMDNSRRRKPFMNLTCRIKKDMQVNLYLLLRIILRPLSPRSEEHTSELQSLMRISYAVFCLKKKNKTRNNQKHDTKTNHTNKYK